MAGIKNIIFDLDGTLIDSAPDIQVAANRLMREINQEEFELKTITGFIGNGVRKLVERCLKARNVSTERLDELALRFKHIYNEAPAEKTIVFEGVREALAGLKSRGFTLAICTNKPAQSAALILRDLKIAPYFDVIIGGDSTAKMKPDPLPLVSAMNAMKGDPQNTIYVGDSETDMHAAQHANLPFYFYQGGYCHIDQNEIKASKTFANFSELIGILET